MVTGWIIAVGERPIEILLRVVARIAVVLVVAGLDRIPELVILDLVAVPVPVAVVDAHTDPIYIVIARVDPFVIDQARIRRPVALVRRPDHRHVGRQIMGKVGEVLPALDVCRRGDRVVGRVVRRPRIPPTVGLVAEAQEDGEAHGGTVRQETFRRLVRRLARPPRGREGILETHHGLEHQMQGRTGTCTGDGIHPIPRERIAEHDKRPEDGHVFSGLRVHLRHLGRRAAVLEQRSEIDSAHRLEFRQRLPNPLGQRTVIPLACGVVLSGLDHAVGEIGADLDRIDARNGIRASQPKRRPAAAICRQRLVHPVRHGITHRRPRPELHADPGVCIGVILFGPGIDAERDDVAVRQLQAHVLAEASVAVARRKEGVTRDAAARRPSRPPATARRVLPPVAGLPHRPLRLEPRVEKQVTRRHRRLQHQQESH